jgi:hypothetical protein
MATAASLLLAKVKGNQPAPQQNAGARPVAPVSTARPVASSKTAPVSSASAKTQPYQSAHSGSAASLLLAKVKGGNQLTQPSRPLAYDMPGYGQTQFLQ